MANQIFFFLLSFIIIAAALGVVFLPSIIFATLALIVSLVGVAAIFMSLQAHFLGAAQIVVYAGAIIVLVLFVVMLLNLKKEILNSSGVIRALVGGSFLLLLFIPFSSFLLGYFNNSTVNLIEGTTEKLGQLLFKNYIFAFEISSVLILAALIGAVALAQKKVSNGPN